MKSPPLLAALCGSIALLGGCASAGTPRLAPVNLAVARAPVALVLDTIIYPNGPGTWAHHAAWDEYVITISNLGREPLTIASVVLSDSRSSYAPGISMPSLEKASAGVEQQCRERGLAFARNAGPRTITTGGGVRVVSATEPALAVAAFLAPVPGFYTRKIVSLSPDDTLDEFAQRRLRLPLNLAPGETRVGSLFFPTVPNPRALSLRWSAGPSTGELTLPLGLVRGLHVPPTPAAATVR